MMPLVLIGIAAAYALALYLLMRWLGGGDDEQPPAPTPSTCEAHRVPAGCRNCRHWRPMTGTVGRCAQQLPRAPLTWSTHHCPEHAPW